MHYIYRSSVTGKIVTAEYADKHPESTQREAVETAVRVPHFPKSIELRRDGLHLDGELFPWYIPQGGVAVRPMGDRDGTNGNVAWLLSVDVMFFADDTTLIIDQSALKKKES